jgi:hypothetical protein
VNPGTVADLWAHARELVAISDREGTPVYARRALVVLAVAGSGGDAAAYEAEAREVLKALARIGLDPLPLFDAASALVAEDDPAARACLVTLPRESQGLVRDELLSRLQRS